MTQTAPFETSTGATHDFTYGYRPDAELTHEQNLDAT